MTPEVLAYFREVYKKSGGQEIPTSKSLASRFNVTEAEAKTWQADFRDSLKKPKVNWIDFAVDGGALVVAVVIDLLLNIVVFAVIAPDWFTRLGMVSLAFVVVLFSVRAWLKGGLTGRLLWAMFALVTAFSDLSFALAATDLQSKQVYEASRDTELDRLKGIAQRDQDYLSSLRAKQVEKGAGYKSQVDAAIVQANKSGDEIKAYTSRVVQHGDTGVLSASSIFTAIPKAAGSGSLERWIAMTFFTLVFLGLQLTLIQAAGKWRKV